MFTIRMGQPEVEDYWANSVNRVAAGKGPKPERTVYPR